MVSLRAADDGIEVAVRNSGSFIPPDYLPQVFEPFYRGDSARTPRTDGQRSAGLGLTIARGFIEVHGGRIRVSSDAETGTTFTLWLPASAGCPRQAG
jgi:signal transduction histidine kinase